MNNADDEFLFGQPFFKLFTVGGRFSRFSIVAFAHHYNIADVSQWSGYASVAITLSLYAHALPEANKRTTETVALALGI